MREADATCSANLVQMASIEADGLMLCIVCITMKPPRSSKGEHVIPVALGGSLTIRRVCLTCDNRLGNTADAGLINLSSVEERRSELGLEGNRGGVPDPKRAELRKPFR